MLEEFSSVRQLHHEAQAVGCLEGVGELLSGWVSGLMGGGWVWIDGGWVGVD